MKKNASKITDLLALTVFAVFAVCVLVVLLYGAGSYRALVQRGEESFRLRTCTQYVATRVLQAETVTVADFDGCPALQLSEQVDGTVYVTRVYCCGGCSVPRVRPFRPTTGRSFCLQRICSCRWRATC